MTCPRSHSLASRSGGSELGSLAREGRASCSLAFELHRQGKEVTFLGSV